MVSYVKDQRPETITTAIVTRVKNRYRSENVSRQFMCSSFARLDGVFQQQVFQIEDAFADDTLAFFHALSDFDPAAAFVSRVDRGKPVSALGFAAICWPWLCFTSPLAPARAGLCCTAHARISDNE